MFEKVISKDAKQSLAILGKSGILSHRLPCRGNCSRIANLAPLFLRFWFLHPEW